LARARMMMTRSRIVKIARAQIGDKYSAGQVGPNSFDCSGLTSYVYRMAAGKNITRTSFTQYRTATKISGKSVMPGDLVFFFKRGVHHVGVYIGAGKMVHSPRAGERVKVSGIYDDWYAKHLSGFGRVLPAV
ncbi:MAG: NlpC/P60 family protein, partial [Actinomycetota bacterium]|nr:NlpC/P60 family protein [Actinomycetota bacterium]